MPADDRTPSPPDPAAAAYRPNLARHRRQFEKYPNPVAWAVPLVILALGVAAVMHVLPDIGLKPGDFARSFERAHRDAVKKHGTDADPRARARADSIAAALEIPAGFPSRIEAAGGRLLWASATHLLSTRQLHMLVRLPSVASPPVSIFAEKFVARDVDRYRRREVQGGRLYFTSLPAHKDAPADSVMLWQEVGILSTTIGAAPEDSLAALAARMLQLSRAAHAQDL